ncbi:hypothetical protein G4O51_07180 [Candidatus Bathyarchaeota archaeon A05DMB-2]|jgi:uncharacterized membrane protein|nr:hypothetical protein [Candidatus Bathyarchaeota archaeon A05DMB-2]
MRLAARTAFVAGLASLIVISAMTLFVSGESRFEVKSLNLTVYRDGLVHVTQTLTVNESFPEIFVPLLASSVEDILVLDQDEEAVDYKIDGSNMTVYTLGAQNILLEYDTVALTKKEAEVWTLTIDNLYSATVFLPQNSTVVYLNQMPTTINTQGSVITLSLYPSSWEISYVLPVLPVDETPDDGKPSASIPNEYLILAAVTIVASVLSALMLVKRQKRRPNVEKILKAYPQLMSDDREVIKFLAEKDGKAFEAEIRERFPDMPRTSLWRLVRRLERLEIVEVKKIGLENQVELKK